MLYDKRRSNNGLRVEDVSIYSCSVERVDVFVIEG